MARSQSTGFHATGIHEPPRAVWRAALLAAVLASASTVGCRTARDDDSGLKTDLGESGNTEVATRFATYKAARETNELGCLGTTNLPRVMITGFGLFTGVEYNISGVVARTFADPTFTPATLTLQGSDSIGSAGVVSSGTVPASANGAVTSVRTMNIRGHDYEICVLALDVIWDLAAAIITYEAEAFQPKMIVMTGRGAQNAIFEGGALNKASIGSGGYQSSGAAHVNNAPQQAYVLPGGPDTAPMTWSNSLLHAKTKSLVSAIGHVVTFVPDARPSNNYICNNVSYVVLQAAAGAEIALAGGKIRWTPSITSEPKVGFFHYPSSATRTRSRIAQWIRVLATAIDTQLAQ